MKIVYLGQVLDYFYKPIYNKLTEPEFVETKIRSLFKNEESKEDEENIETLLSCMDNKNEEDEQVIRNAYFIIENELNNKYELDTNSFLFNLDVFRLSSGFLTWKSYRYIINEIRKISGIEQKKDYINKNIFFSSFIDKKQKEDFIE